MLAEGGVFELIGDEARRLSQLQKIRRYLLALKNSGRLEPNMETVLRQLSQANASAP